MRIISGYLSMLMLGVGVLFAPAQAQDYIPDAEPLPGEYAIPEAEPIPDAEPLPEVAPIPYAEPIPEAEPIPGENIGGPLPEPETEPKKPMFSATPVPQHETQVAVLCYHDFSNLQAATDMRINTEVFRTQMQYLKDNGINVISMKDFLEWKLGKRQLPEKCVMITIDDGWKSVYTDAYPILKKLGFPFTVFLYTKFISGAGASMNPAQITEMTRHGATVGSHSTSHLYPKSWRNAKKKGEINLLELADKEIKNSRTTLTEKLPGSTISTYCYPGGFVMPEMVTKAEEAGYQAAFTVVPKKVTKDTDRWRIHRYVVHGKNPATFTNAITFRPRTQTAPTTAPGNGTLSDFMPPPAQPVSPAANTVVDNNAPDIAISMANEQDALVNSLEMRVSGFGVVDAKFNKQDLTYRWTPSRHLRTSPVTVHVRWKNKGSSKWQQATWQFGVKEPESRFVPKNIVK